MVELDLYIHAVASSCSRRSVVLYSTCSVACKRVVLVRADRTNKFLSWERSSLCSSRLSDAAAQAVCPVSRHRSSSREYPLR